MTKYQTWRKDTLSQAQIQLQTQVQWPEVFGRWAQWIKEAALVVINMLDMDKKLDFMQMSIFIGSNWPFPVKPNSH